MPTTIAAGDGERLEAGPGADHPPSTADPTTAPGADPPEAPTTAVMGTPEQWGTVLRETIPSRFMYASLIQPFKMIDERAYKAYRDQLLADCGSPTDPIEVMVIEQLAIAHMNFGFLQVRGTNAPTIQAAGVYASAAARLMAEFRRSALALQAYRAASRNLAAPSGGDIVVPTTDPVDQEPEESQSTTELGATDRSDRDEGYIIPFPRAASV